MGHLGVEACAGAKQEGGGERREATRSRGVLVLEVRSQNAAELQILVRITDTRAEAPL